MASDIDAPGGAFAPRIHVLTPEPSDVAPPDLSYDAVLRRFPSLSRAEAICWTGSTAIGWGNALSDVDLYAFCDEELDLPADDTAEIWPSVDSSGVRWMNWMGRYGDVCLDLEIWTLDSLASVLRPYLDGNEPEWTDLSPDLQDFVYRMSIAIPLHNDGFFTEARAMVARSTYPRALARVLKATAENNLVDVAGQLQSGDAITARNTATLAAFAVADHCLVLAGELCRRRKWLLRRLAVTPGCGITVDEYRSEVLDGGRPGESDADCALRIARWAQYHLIRVEDEALSVRRGG